MTSQDKIKLATYDETTFFALLPQPSSSYTVMVQALNGAGEGQSVEAEVSGECKVHAMY